MSTATARFRICELQLYGAAVKTFSLNCASQANSATAGAPRDENGLGSGRFLLGGMQIGGWQS